MTREELKSHCEKEIARCEFWSHNDNEKLNNSKIYQEHKLVLELLQQEPCTDAVSRADTLQSFESYCEKNCQYSKKQRDVMCGACMMGDAIEIVEDLPPVTPKQKIGRWIDDKCSVCGKGIEDLISSPEWYRNEEPNFCPYCGVKLGGKSE